MKWQPGNY